ncbi:MAG: hypothetical protein MK135_09695 [Polyangiaceae bacterium]|nr:hypothetical protein [Polyangiaceae bacterium]
MRQKFWAGVGALVAGLSLFPSACNLGPYPDFLEPLDKLSPLEGQATTWVSVDDDGAYYLVLSDGGNFMLSRVGRNTSVLALVGSYQFVGSSLELMSVDEYSLPKETGGISSRAGAQRRTINQTKTYRVELGENRLNIEGLAEFQQLSTMMRRIDVREEEGGECLMRIVQSHIRTSQSRIPRFGGSGTAMYINNQVDFAGVIAGSFSIVIKKPTSPETVIDYDDFSDFPGFRFNGPYTTFVNLVGTGYLEGASEVEIQFDPEVDWDELLNADSMGGSPDNLSSDSGNGMGGAPPENDGYKLTMSYGPPNNLEIEKADVAGGDYRITVTQPIEYSFILDWPVLEDLDLRVCPLE